MKNAFLVALLGGALLCAPALAQDIEDLPLDDAPPPLPPAPAGPSVTPPATPQVVLPPATIPAVPSVPAQTGAPASSGETVTVSREVFEQLLRDVAELKAARAGQGAPAAGAPALNSTAPGAGLSGTGVPGTPNMGTPSELSRAPLTDTVSDATGRASVGDLSTPDQPVASRNYLLLPDISLIADSRIVGSTDKRDDARNTLDTDVELGIQGYVYPRVRYDTFIVGNPGEEEFGVEEGYLTYQGVAKGLNINVGRKFAPFGRTGELHPHSWLYSRQFIARQSLVAGENLVGNGINLNYLLPTGKSFFTRASLGYFTAGEEGIARVNQTDSNNPFFDGEFPQRPGSGLRKFTNARLWAGKALSERDELEIGTSYANGTTSALAFSEVSPGDPQDVEFNGRVALTGYDASFRRFLPNGRRLLLRGEYFKYNPNKSLPTNSTSGYYGFANLRLNPFNDIGFLAERTGFPQAPGARETAYSLIYTRQFNERYYIRLTGTNGDRPGQGNYSEVRLQFVAGLGPHTHELE